MVEVSLAGRDANGGVEDGGRLSALAGCCPSCPYRGGLVSAAAVSHRRTRSTNGSLFSGSCDLAQAVESRVPPGKSHDGLCKATLSRFWSAAFLYDILHKRGPIAAHHAFRTPRGQFSFDYPVHHVTR
ncbi:hypothetical protein MRX96_059442 [Rhipicephalus microplus]